MSFNYEEFAKDLKEEAADCDFIKIRDDVIREIAYKNIYDYALIAGENYLKEGYSDYDCEIYTQLIAEWILHKTLDLYDGCILEEFHEEILQKIAFTIYETIKQIHKKNIALEKTVSIVEHYVEKRYEETIKELFDEGKIEKESLNKALKVSSINNYSKINKKKTHYTSIKNTAENCANTHTEWSLSPLDMYEHLGVDILSIHIAQNLIPLLTPEKKNVLNVQVGELRKKLSDDLGYIIPSVRIMDRSDFADGKYSILVRGIECYWGFVSGQGNKSAEIIVRNLRKICITYVDKIL